MKIIESTDGEITIFIKLTKCAVYKDLTKEKQEEADKELSAKVFDTSLEGIIITDENTNIVKANRSFSEMTGFQKEEVLGRKLDFLKSKVHNKEFFIDMWSSIEKNGNWQGEVWDKRKNGEHFPVYLNISTVYDKNGKVRNYIGVYLDITEQKKNQEHIYKLAYQDVLTGIANRTLFDIEVENYINRAIRKNEQFALLFLDLDNFKYINDTFGHDIGDELLIEVSQRLKGVLRKSDFLARLGGDEFVIVVDIIEHNDEIGILCNRILNTFEERFEIGEQIFRVSSSIGISIFPEDGENKNTLVKNADTAMYQAKKDGKNRFFFHTKGMNKEFIRKLEIDTHLREAIKENCFEVYYQPKISLKKDITLRAEALIRWKDERLGQVSPSEFIPYAEEAGLIIPIGNFVMERVFNQLHQLEKHKKNFKISINISSLQLAEKDFVEVVENLIKTTKCNPEMVEFEITESKIMENVMENIEKLERIKSMGITISIDDFGTGYSSMSYLQKLPVDIIKIDKSFIDNIETSDDGNMIVKGIISLAKGLSLKTVAEGVEEKSQKQFLKKIGCDMIQGYLYSKPLKWEELLRYIK